MARHRLTKGKRLNLLSRGSIYENLEHRLVLLSWLNSLFGYEYNIDLLDETKFLNVEFDYLGSDKSTMYRHFESRIDKIKIPVNDLLNYDKNIRIHLDEMNFLRTKPITLQYFQYLAVLYTEVYLDRFFNRRGELIRRLNEFVSYRNSRKSTFETPDKNFTESDLKKLAFWMATGSGKTLIMHVNFRQFLHYNDKSLDNIILITPNEGLSEQHITEMMASNIPCRRFDLNDRMSLRYRKNSVQVIEITKLVEEKLGEGKSIPVEAFEGNNLIFVDEGHKGSGREKWRRYRDELGETGFTFEYSATFGQALAAVKSDSLFQEYGKAILFDYSYRYFYNDGYGKDFYILNLKEETTEEKTNILLLGNLLSFYEQQKIFKEQAEALKQYRLEKPLWMFVGSSVVYRENSQNRSDVLTVVRFLQQMLENQKNWAIRTIDNILHGNSGMETPEGKDVFQYHFEYIKNSGMSSKSIYQDLLTRLTHTRSGGALHLVNIRGSKGEIGIKASATTDYFGVIYIGDPNTFKKLVEEFEPNIILEEDALAESLFQGIGNTETTINVLIGAKKFMEGWNSWRVSNMGLLNIGLKAGSEIIQLFGRGVRLRGLDMSLKRSSVLEGNHPDNIEQLETLNIFAVRANYMSQFRGYLENEGIETENKIQLPLKIVPKKEYLKKGLVVPRVPKDNDFFKNTVVLLKPEANIQPRVDLSLKVQTLESGDFGVSSVDVQTGREVHIPPESLDLVDWEIIHLKLLAYKRIKGYTNLAILPGSLRKILERPKSQKLYSLIADDSTVTPQSFSDTFKLLESILTILKNYVDKFYRIHQERWESKLMEYTEIDEKDTNFQDYTVSITISESELISVIQNLIDEDKNISLSEEDRLGIVAFDRHLYQPLLVEKNDLFSSNPPTLNKHEKKFVEDLRQYWQVEKEKVLMGKEIYLLRNLSRGKGVSFFEKRGFYPDFILWIKDSVQQKIIFIEPHGMVHAGPYENDDKARLHEALPSLSEEMKKRTKLKNVSLDSYIISVTPYEKLKDVYDDGSWNQEKFTSVHILFFERSENYDYMSFLMSNE